MRICTLLCLLLACPAAVAAPVERISVNASGEEANGESDFAVPSATGRYVVFVSSATNLIEGDVNGHPDVFLKDRETGEVELISVASDGTQGNNWSGNGGMGFTSAPRLDVTPDGRFVVFLSQATNLVAGVTDLTNVYLRDRQTQQTEQINFDADGEPSPAFSTGPVSISDDGRFVVYQSVDGTYDTGPDVTFVDILLRDRQEGTTTLVSVNNAGEQAAPAGPTNNNNNDRSDITGDGRLVVFQTSAPNLVPDDSNDATDVFVRDILAGTTSRVSVADDGSQADGPSQLGAIDATGRYVVFTSAATNLVPEAGDDETGLYVRDLLTGTTQRLLEDLDETLFTIPDPGSLSYGRNISGDGRFVVFSTELDTLAGGDANEERDVFRLERATGVSTLLSRSLSGGTGSDQSDRVTINDDGRVMVFTSEADDLVDDDTNRVADIFAAGDILPAAHPYEYAAKMVCGDQSSPEDLRLTRGRYATTVNVHNPKTETVAFSKKLALSIPPGGQQPGAIMPIDVHELAYDAALAVDCSELRQRLFPDGFPDGLIEGFLVLESQGPLDVIGVYTTARFDPGAPEGVSQSSIDVEQVAERRRSADLSVVKAVSTLPIPVTDGATWHIVLNQVAISNAGPDAVTGAALSDLLSLDAVSAFGAAAIVTNPITLPPGAEIVAAEFISPSLSMLDIAFDTIDPGDAVLVSFFALALTVQPPALPESHVELTDRASVQSPALEAVPTDNVAEATVVLVP
jgi:Tol biopolymer transport system component